VFDQKTRTCTSPVEANGANAMRLVVSKALHAAASLALLVKSQVLTTVRQSLHLLSMHLAQIFCPHLTVRIQKSIAVWSRTAVLLRNAITLHFVRGRPRRFHSV